MEKEWDDVEAFVSDLKLALDQEAKTIRETELDQTGEYHTVSLRLRSKPRITTSDPEVATQEADWLAENAEVFVDRLGRVILPAKERYEDVMSITFLDEGNGGGSIIKKVVSIETRFKGQRPAAYVVYLEGEE